MSAPRSQSIGLVVAGLLLGSCAELRPDCEVGLDYASKYVARGAVLFDGPAVQPSFSASLEQGGGTLEAGAWSTIDANDHGGNRGRFTEIDTYVEYQRPLGPITGTVGLLRYDYPHTGFASSGEVHLAAGYENEVATPTLHAWYDYDQADGTYLSFDLARGFDLSERWSLALAASLGWMDGGQGRYYFGVDSPGLSDLTATAALSYAASESLGVTWTLGAARVVDPDFRAAVDEADSAWLLLGLRFGF